MFNAFETLTLIGALSHDKPRLLRGLPFAFHVPWEDLIIWLDTAQYILDPLGSIRHAVDSLSMNNARARLALMERWRDSITWTAANSTAADNVLASAYRASTYLSPGDSAAGCT
jgi:hypothetical protein